MPTLQTPLHILFLEGDGIGPEIASAAAQVLRHLNQRFGLALEFDAADIGWKAFRSQQTTFPRSVLEHARRADGVVLGPVSHNEYPSVEAGGVNPSGELRRQLDLYANIRPARSRAGIRPKAGNSIDLVIVRENTEGFYADRSMFAGPGEILVTADTALSFRRVTRSASTRIARTAFELANARRKQVTAVHKANVLRLSDGLFLQCVREVAAQFPGVAYEEQLIDSMAALLVRDPSRFDVVVATNMFGDILSDEASEISGSIGLGGSLNIGTGHIVAQAQHGSAPDIAGQDQANPTSLLSSCAMLLDWLGKERRNERLVAAGAALESALDSALSSASSRTRDLGGPLGTQAFTQEVIMRLGGQT